MAIITTIAGATSNSYVSMNSADKYFENHPFGSVWTSTEANLIYAGVMLNSLVNWNYESTTTTQSMHFPVTVGGVDQTTIPIDIINAQLELAYYLETNTEVLADNSLDELEIGPIKLNFNQDVAGQQELLPPLVQGFISKWGKTNSSGSNLGVISLVRG